MERSFGIAAQFLGEKTGLVEPHVEDIEVTTQMEKLESTEKELRGLVTAASGFLDPDDSLTKMKDKVVGFMSAEDIGNAIDNPAQRLLDEEIAQAHELEGKYNIARLALDSATTDHTKALSKNSKQAFIDEKKAKLDEAKLEFTEIHDSLLAQLRLIENKKDQAFRDTVKQLSDMLSVLKPSWESENIPLNDQQAGSSSLMQAGRPLDGGRILGERRHGRQEVLTPREHGEGIL